MNDRLGRYIREVLEIRDSNVISMIIGNFCTEMDVGIKRIGSAQAELNFTAAAKTAHGLKGCCANLGETGLGELCKAVEGAAAAGNSAAISELLEKLQSELNIFKKDNLL